MEKDKNIEHIIEIVKELHICGRKKENVTSLNDVFENLNEVIKKKDKLALELTESLKLIIPINNDSINELMTYLYSVKKFKIEIVDDILKENNYEEKLNDFIWQMNDVIENGGKLEGMSKNILEILFETNIISGPLFLKDNYKNIKYNFINYINMNYLLQKENFSYECILKTIENLTEVMGNVNDLRTACYIVPSTCLKDSNSTSLGVADEEFVYLNEDIVKDYYNKVSVSVFYTLFHELVHINQNRRHDGLLPINPQADLRQMKEMIIRKAYPEYYDLNYDVISSEKEANILGNMCAERYFNLLGISLIDKEQMNKNIEEEIKKNENDLRTIDGTNIFTLEELFLKVINEKRELFNKFSVLGLLYKEENDKIIPRTEQEIKRLFEINKHNREIVNFHEYEPNFEVLNYMVNGGSDVKNK